MIVDELIRTKSIVDPLFASIQVYMEKRLDELRQGSDQEAFKLAELRYTRITNSDVQIEPPVPFPNGRMVACFMSSSRGFFHADALIEKVNMDAIFKSLAISTLPFTMDELIAEIHGQRIYFGVFYLTDRKQYVIVLNGTQKSVKDAMKTTGDVYWTDMTLTMSETLDTTTGFSGSFEVEAPNIDKYTFGVIYTPHYPGVTTRQSKKK